MPWYLLYDYVEVFTYNKDSNEFTLDWRDDFETFDTDRWHKASGGFDANSSVFHPDNVSVKAGNLVLKMEPAPENKKAESVGEHLEGPYIHSQEHTHRHHVVHEDFHGDDQVEETLRHHHHHRSHKREHGANLHKSEHFDREHARSHRSAPHDAKFWIAHEHNLEADEEREYDNAEDNDASDESSDSEADWREYQEYIQRQQYDDEEHVYEVHDAEADHYDEEKSAFDHWKDDRQAAHHREEIVHEDSYDHLDRKVHRHEQSEPHRYHEESTWIASESPHHYER